MIPRTRSSLFNPHVAKVLREMGGDEQDAMRSLAAHVHPHFDVLSEALGEALARMGFDTLAVGSKANAVIEAALKELGRQVPGLDKAIDPGHSTFGNRLENFRKLSERPSQDRTPEPIEGA
jgi:hypothetical protein